MLAPRHHLIDQPRRARPKRRRDPQWPRYAGNPPIPPTGNAQSAVATSPRERAESSTPARSAACLAAKPDRVVIELRLRPQGSPVTHFRPGMPCPRAQARAVAPEGRWWVVIGAGGAAAGRKTRKGAWPTRGYIRAGIHVKQRAAISRRRRHDAFVLYGAGHVLVVNNDGSAIAATAREACEVPNFSESRRKAKTRSLDPIAEAHRRHRNGERHKYGTNCCRVSPLFHVEMLASD